MTEPTEMELVTQPQQSVTKHSPIDILEAAVRGGITRENVEVVKELAIMAREQRAEDAKAAFARALFQLRKEMPIIYADKEVHTKSGALAFEYCSPDEIKGVLEPLLFRHGFCLMTDQKLDDGQVTVALSLIHEAGHSTTTHYTCRVSPGNSLMSPSQCDAAATTSAERHAMIKTFWLRTRVREEDDARNLGQPITPEQADELQRRCKETNSNEPAFLKFAGVSTHSTPPTIEDYRRIPSLRYDEADKMLRKKEAQGK